MQAYRLGTRKRASCVRILCAWHGMASRTLVWACGYNCWHHYTCFRQMHMANVVARLLTSGSPQLLHVIHENFPEVVSVCFNQNNISSMTTFKNLPSLCPPIKNCGFHVFLSTFCTLRSAMGKRVCHSVPRFAFQSCLAAMAYVVFVRNARGASADAHDRQHGRLIFDRGFLLAFGSSDEAMCTVLESSMHRPSEQRVLWLCAWPCGVRQPCAALHATSFGLLSFR
jgi:hypothetical protein